MDNYQSTQSVIVYRSMWEQQVDQALMNGGWLIILVLIIAVVLFVCVHAAIEKYMRWRGWRNLTRFEHLVSDYITPIASAAAIGFLVLMHLRNVS